MIEFFKSLLDGGYNFTTVIEFFGKLIEDARANETIAALTNSIFGGLGGIVPIVMIIIGAFSLIFGQKVIGMGKFFLSAIIGYGVGVIAVTPAINNVFPLSEGICGLVVAIVAAVCCKTVYGLAYVGFSAVFAYAIFYANGLIPFALPTEGNQTLCYIVSAIIIITLLITRRHVERIGLSALGAHIVTEVVAVNYIAAMQSFKIWIFVALWVLGYLYQYRKRRRY